MLTRWWLVGSLASLLVAFTFNAIVAILNQDPMFSKQARREGTASTLMIYASSALQPLNWWAGPTAVSPLRRDPLLATRPTCRKRLEPGDRVESAMHTFQLVEMIRDAAVVVPNSDENASSGVGRSSASDTRTHGRPQRGMSLSYPSVDLAVYDYIGQASDTGQFQDSILLGELWPAMYDADGLRDRVFDMSLDWDTTSTVLATVVGTHNYLRLGQDEAIAMSVEEDRWLRLEALETRYVVGERFGKGAYGEVWRATLNREEYVLKRMFLEKGSAVRLSGLREIEFGQIFSNHLYIARFIEFFEDNVDTHCHSFSGSGSESPQSTTISDDHSGQANNGEAQSLDDNMHLDGTHADDTGAEDTGRDSEQAHSTGSTDSSRGRQGVDKELWLVFKNEGVSLRSLLYTAVSDGSGYSHVERSVLWSQLKTTSEGLLVIKSLVRQMLAGLSMMHAKGVIHRDIKPDNMFVHLVKGDQGLKHRNVILRVGDMGNAVNILNAQHLYGEGGPSAEESTQAYAPPETLFGGEAYSKEFPESFDMWSVGIVMMELVLGTADVFRVDSRVRAIINHRMADRSERDKRSACMYQMMQRFCFHAYDVSDKQTKMDIDYFSNAKLPALSQEHIVREQTAHRCNDRTLYEQLRIADTLGVGFPTLMGTDLIKRLLRWDPTNRVAADKALTHAYFTNPNGDKPFVCSLCGKEMVFMSDYRRHMAAKECNHS